jgi:hypothetical protein
MPKKSTKSNKLTFTRACALFNNRQWDALSPLLDDKVQCFYLNRKTKPTYTKADFLKHQKEKPQNENFAPHVQYWNDNDTAVTGFGTWTDDDGDSAPIAFFFRFKKGLIDYMWGNPTDRA